jgi:hypothetical protein
MYLGKSTFSATNSLADATGVMRVASYSDAYGVSRPSTRSAISRPAAVPHVIPFPE